MVVVSWCAGVGMAMMVHKCPPPCLLSGVGMVMMVQKAKKEDEDGRKAGEGKNQKLLVPLHTLGHHQPPTPFLLPTPTTATRSWRREGGSGEREREKGSVH